MTATLSSYKKVLYYQFVDTNIFSTSYEYILHEDACLNTKKFPNSPCFYSIPESVDDQRTFIQRLAKLGIHMEAYSNAYHQNDTKRYNFLHHTHSNLPKNINFFPPPCFL